MAIFRRPHYLLTHSFSVSSSGFHRIPRDSLKPKTMCQRCYEYPSRSLLIDCYRSITAVKPKHPPMIHCHEDTNTPTTSISDFDPLGRWSISYYHCVRNLVRFVNHSSRHQPLLFSSKLLIDIQIRCTALHFRRHSQDTARGPDYANGVSGCDAIPLLPANHNVLLDCYTYQKVWAMCKSPED